ncbi:hypothetical protein GEMRC1_004967 [Eukaryota sp. GEM-RC1]
MYQTDFKSDFDITSSYLEYSQASKVVFLSTLTVRNSSLTLSSGYPIVSKYVLVDPLSEISSKFLDLSRLFSNLSISPSKQCCNTSSCQISLLYNHVHFLEPYLDLSVNRQNEFTFIFQLKSIDFSVSDIITFNPSNSSIYLNFSIAENSFSDQLSIPICPIEFVSLEPPTRGGFVPLFAFNLGLYLIVIHHSTASINQSLAYSSTNHKNLELFFFEGHGCHELVLSRSTDSSIISFTYCFKKPVISFVSPYPFFLNGELSIIGQDLSTSFDYSSLVSEIASTRVDSHFHEEIVHYIPFVCSVETNIFHVFLIIGNQTSNVYQLELAAPRHGFLPLVLSPSGNLLRIFGTNLGKMFNCFDNSTIQMSGAAAQVQAVTTDEVSISTGDLVGLRRFISHITFNSGISIILSIPITSLEARNASFVCFVNQACKIEVFSLYGEVPMNNFQISSNIPNYIQILDFHSSITIAHITFFSVVSGSVEDFELCNEFGCFPIFNLPFIVFPVSVFPRFIQWFDFSIVHVISLEVEGIHLYEFSAIEQSFGFGDLDCRLHEIQDTGVSFEVDVISRGFFPVLGSSFNSTFDLNLAFEVDDYLVLPPIIQFYSRIEFLLLEQISNIFLSHGSQSIILTTGSNVFQLLENDPVMMVYRSTESKNVSVISDLIGDQLPQFYEVDCRHSFMIDFHKQNYYVSVECITNCEIFEQSSASGLLIFSFLSSNEGESTFQFVVHYYESSFTFRLVRQVVLPPIISFTSPLLFSTIDDVLVSFSILSKCVLFSEFHLNNSALFYDQTQLFISDFALFPYVYHFSFNITGFAFSQGESDLQWSWNNIGFSNQIIGNIKIFNTDFNSVDHVSVYEPRDIRVDFAGLLYSQFNCIVHIHSFPGTVVDSALFCKGVIISTFQEIVPVTVFYKDLLIDSFTVHGEAYLEEICFLSAPHHPQISTRHYTSSIPGDFIFDGSRCCNVDVSFCSEFLSFNNSMSVSFNSSFDIFTVIVTTNSSCEDFDFALPFQLSVNNHTRSPSYSCNQIPSGFAFALMCEIDDVLPGVFEISLTPRRDLFLLELEFYGYKSNSCFTPIDVNKGLSPLGEELEEIIHLQYNTETFTSFELFKNSVSQSSRLISAPQLSYSLYLSSPRCFHSKVPYTVTFTRSEPFELVFNEFYTYTDTGGFNFSIPVLCMDFVGFIVDCSGNVTILNSQFDILFELRPNFQHHNLKLEFLGKFVETNFTFVQQFTEFLNINTFDDIECTHQLLFDKCCTLLRPTITLNQQLHFFNSSEIISNSELLVSSTSDQVVVHIYNDVLEIISNPLQSVTVVLSYFDQSTTLDLITNDCPFPKINSGHGCLCPAGMEFNVLGDCAPCPLNYYSNLEFNVDCRSCHFPRITLETASTNITYCVCPLNTLDSADSCLPCPHLAECGYGNLTGIEPGFRLNTETWELDECDLWFNCQENSCRSRHAYGNLCQYCTDDSISTRIYCIGDDDRVTKVLLFCLLLIIVFFTDRSMSKLVVLRQKRNNSFGFVTSKFQQLLIVRSMSKFTNFLFIILSLSILFTKSISSVLVFFEFVLSLFKFDNETYFTYVLLFTLLSVFSAKVLFKNTKQFKFYHSAFLTTSALISINFIFGTLHQRYLVSSQTVSDSILLLTHSIYLVSVLVLQRTNVHLFPLITYIVMITSSFFTLSFHLIIQTVLLLCLSISSVHVERYVFAILSIVSVHFAFSVSKLH